MPKELFVEKVKLTGYITHEQLKKIVVFTKPKGKCVKVEMEIEIVPIKEKNGKKQSPKVKNLPNRRGKVFTDFRLINQQLKGG